MRPGADGGDTLVYVADLMPTRHHLPLPWIMGYDVEPLRTLESKRKLIREALDEGWWLFFEHDPGRGHGSARGEREGPRDRRTVPAPKVTL